MENSPDMLTNRVKVPIKVQVIRHMNGILIKCSTKKRIIRPKQKRMKRKKVRLTPQIFPNSHAKTHPNISQTSSIRYSHALASQKQNVNTCAPAFIHSSHKFRSKQRKKNPLSDPFASSSVKKKKPEIIVIP